MNDAYENFKSLTWASPWHWHGELSNGSCPFPLWWCFLSFRRLLTNCRLISEQAYSLWSCCWKAHISPTKIIWETEWVKSWCTSKIDIYIHKMRKCRKIELCQGKLFVLLTHVVQHTFHDMRLGRNSSTIF